MPINYYEIKIKKMKRLETLRTRMNLEFSTYEEKQIQDIVNEFYLNQKKNSNLKPVSTPIE